MLFYYFIILFASTEISQIIFKHSTKQNQMISLMEAQPVKKLNASMPRTGRAINKFSIEFLNYLNYIIKIIKTGLKLINRNNKFIQINTIKLTSFNNFPDIT